MFFYAHIKNAKRKNYSMSEGSSLHVKVVMLLWHEIDLGSGPCMNPTWPMAGRLSATSMAQKPLANPVHQYSHVLRLSYM